MRVLLTPEELQQGVRRMACDIRRLYPEPPVTIVGVLMGSVVLLADLIRSLEIPLRLDLVQTRSYRGTEPGPLVVNTEMLGDIRGRHVLLVDDIFDTSQTLAELIPQIAALGPKSVRTAVLLLKEGRARVAMRPDIVGFTVPDVFVVGYGLDYNDAYRNLPYVAALEADDLAGEPAA